ncbi:MAG: response regulator [Bacteroidetes bacterium]|nr:response regulator [Bacteroidota bacterium]
MKISKINTLIQAKQKSGIILFFILFLSSIVSSQNNNLRTKYFTLEDGLSQVSTNDLLLDNLGFVWIATQDGLNRFDGKVFKHYKHNESDSTTISGNLINKLLEDHKGNIWVGTIGNGLNYYNPNLDLFHQIKLENSPDENEIISGLATNRQGDLWVASRISGLHRFQYNDDGSFLQKNFFANQPLSALLIDKHENIWVGGLHGMIYKFNFLGDKSIKEKPEIIVKGNVQAFYNTYQHLLIGSDFGFYIYDLKTNKVGLFELEKMGEHPTKHVSSFLKNDDSSVWIGTGSGLFLFDWSQKKVIKKIKYSNDNNGLSNNTVQALLKLPNQQLIVGTANYLNLLSFTEPSFKNISRDQRGAHILNDNVIFSIFKEQNDLWIGTSDGGLNLIRNGLVYSFRENQNDPTSISGDVVRSIVKDNKNQRLWLATSRGLSMIDLRTFNPKNPKFTVFNHNPDDPNSINGDFIKDLALDKNNNLWGATYGYGIFHLTMLNNKVKIIQYKNEKDNPNSLKNDFGQCIEVDRNNNIWIGTQGGLTKLSLMNSDNLNPVFTNYFKSSNSENPLSHNSVYDILIDRKEQIWLGTRRGFNLFLQKNEFESWTAQKQFPNDVVYSIQDGIYGDLWLGTNDGMVRFNPENHNFTHYSIEDNIQSKEFNIHARFRDTNGFIYMGGIGGVTYFHPKYLENIDSSKHLYFSQLRVKDKVIKPNKGDNELLNQNISETKTLTFNHNQFPFYLQFSSIDFRLNKDVKYAYKLLPSDSEWNLLKDPEIQFLNLPSGKYTLQINGFSRGKEWSQAPLEMTIEVVPTWWARWWAYLIYLALAIAFADRFYRFQLSRRLAVAESKRLKEVNRVKNALYTNITHEFRTPLTVINGMTDSIKSDIENKQFEDAEKSLEMIQRNSNGLLHLVNEMLDLAKLESGNMKLQLIQANVIPFVKYLSESFHSLAQKKQINLTVYSEVDQLMMDFDSKKLSVIITNLLSNAVKFTPPSGKIVVHLNRIIEGKNEFFVLKIKDNGPGISEDEIANVFNRFYQTENSSTGQENGTGIGLALSKELVELIGGKIELTSEVKMGCTFIINIPISNKAELVQENRIELENQILSSSSVSEHEQQFKTDTGLPLVLIIEDNEDVAFYLQKCLKGKYESIHAKNGIEGIKMAYDKIPDIIISDVMMPGKDGFEVCETLKSDELTDHIPIILLTAKATIQDRLIGLSHGADAYLAKPFVKAELFTRLDQLILSRTKMRHKFENSEFSGILNKRIVDPETKFLQKVVKIIHENISNHSFGATQLAHKLSLSESQVYRKLKAISGKSTAVFIRSIRLQKGKELIQTTENTISEIAYEVGFNDPAWFSRAFKEEFGFAPSAISK